jgi:hypothetical protein
MGLIARQIKMGSLSIELHSELRRWSDVQLAQWRFGFTIDGTLQLSRFRTLQTAPNGIKLRSCLLSRIASKAWRSHPMRMLVTQHIVQLSVFT